MATAPSTEPTPPDEQRPWWRRPVLLVPALATVLAAVLGPLATATLSHEPSPAGTGSGPASPTGAGATAHGGATTGPTSTNPTSTSPAAWTVSWAGNYEVGGNGVNFDDQPPGPASADVYYNGALSTNDATTMSVWPHPSAPTADCADWVRTHPGAGVFPLTVGMQICLHTLQDRAVLLRVEGLPDPQSQAGITTQVTVWQRP